MRGPHALRASIDAELVLLEREHVVEIELDDLDGLLREPDLPAFARRRGPRRSGLEDVALTLAAAKVQPDDLVVRVAVPIDVAPEQIAEAEAAMRSAAADAARVAWREAVSIRNMGLRQLPIGIAIALIAAVAAYGFGYLGGSVDNLATRALCFTLAGIAITVAWVVSWMVVEDSMLTWRAPARQTAAYDLLSRATLEVVPASR